MPVQTRAQEFQRKDLDQKELKSEQSESATSESQIANILQQQQDLLNHSTSTMTDKLINTILSNDVNKLPKFGGKSDDNVYKWLKDVTIELNLVNLTDAQKLSVIQTCLVDDARRWFINNKLLIVDWDTFEYQMKKAFSLPLHQELALRKVGARQQGSSETVLHYYNDMIELFDMIDINMTDQYKVAYLKASLKVSLKKEVMRKDPQTATQFLEMARIEEKLESSLHMPIQNEFSSSVDYLSALRSPPRTAALQPKFEQNSKRIRCFRCNKIGHFARNCFSKNY